MHQGACAHIPNAGSSCRATAEQQWSASVGGADHWIRWFDSISSASHPHIDCDSASRRRQTTFVFSPILPPSGHRMGCFWGYPTFSIRSGHQSAPFKRTNLPLILSYVSRSCTARGILVLAEEITKKKKEKEKKNIGSEYPIQCTQIIPRPSRSSCKSSWDVLV